MSDDERQSSRDARNVVGRRSIQSISTQVDNTPLQSVTASVAALTKQLNELTAAKAMDVDADAPPPLQSILKKAPKYSLAKMTQRPGPVPAHPPTGEFYLDAQGQPTHPRS